MTVEEQSIDKLEKCENPQTDESSDRQLFFSTDGSEPEEERPRPEGEPEKDQPQDKDQGKETIADHNNGVKDESNDGLQNQDTDPSGYPSIPILNLLVIHKGWAKKMTWQEKENAPQTKI